MLRLLAYAGDMMNENAANQRYFHLEVAGQLDARWQDWFDGMTVTPTADGTTLLSGPVRDQAALYGLLKRINNVGLTLIAVNRYPPD